MKNGPLLATLIAGSLLRAATAIPQGKPGPKPSPSPAAPAGSLVDALALKALKARSIGPAVMGGRVADVALDPKDSATFYVALGTGGLVKTADNGSTTPEAEPARNRLGMSVSDITPQLRQQYSIGDNLNGVVVTNVKDVSPAGEANISEGDVISEVKGQRVTSVDQFRRIVDGLKSGDYVRMYVTSSNRGGRPFASYRILQVP